MASWRENITNSDEVALSSQINISRNIKGYNYPNMLDKSQALEIADLVKNILDKEYPDIFASEKTSDLLYPGLMLENNLISQGLIDNINISSFHISQDERLNIMVNEDDHINIQVMSVSNNLEKDYKIGYDIVDLLETYLEFSYHEEYGYLSSSPSKLGTGLIITISLHLPGIFYSGYIQKLASDLNQYGVSIEGNFGGKFEYTGNIFKISNMRTLGMTEEEIVYKMKSISNHIIDIEKNIIGEFQDKYPILFEDAIYRSMGVLKYSKQISEKEAQGAISNVITGISTGVYKGLTMKQAVDLFLSIKKENILKYKKDKNLYLSEKEVRSYYIKEFFKEAEINA